MKLALMVLALALMTGSAEAQQGTYQVIGPGNLSCGTWLAHRRRSGPEWVNGESWIVGFLSGVGYTGADTGYDPLKGTDADGVFAWIDGYCQNHPLETIAQAGGAFVQAHPR